MARRLIKGGAYRMKCSICNGDGVVTFNKMDKNGYFNDAFFMKECSVCHGTGKVQTNEEWFDELSTEEKAMVIICCCPYETDWFGDNFEKRMEQRIKDISKATYGYEHGVNKIKNWLKEVHNG